MKKYSWIIVVFSIWIVISGIISFSEPFYFWNNLIAGWIILVAGIYRAEGDAIFGFIILLLGMWIALTSSITVFAEPALQLGNDVIVGGAATILGLISLTVETELPGYKLANN